MKIRATRLLGAAEAAPSLSEPDVLSDMKLSDSLADTSTACKPDELNTQGSHRNCVPGDHDPQSREAGGSWPKPELDSSLDSLLRRFARDLSGARRSGPNAPRCRLLRRRGLE